MRSLEVFLAFLRFGLIGFGGPLAHVAMFEEEFVRRRSWISRERFLERMSLTQLIPGPNSTELSMQIGYERAGWPGFFLGGLAFLLPAVLMVAGLAELYAHLGGFATVARWVWGTKPVVGALILVMLFHSGRTVLRPSPRLFAIAAGFALILLGQPSPTALAMSAALWLLYLRDWRRFLGFLVAAALPYVPLTFAPSAGAPTVPALFLEMLYLGSMVIGSGYVLFSYFSFRLVDNLRWTDPQTLTMAIAAGQLTPGPLFASAAFFGQLLHGAAGAAACAIGIFLPAFFFSAISIPLARRLEESSWWKESLQVMSAVAVLMLGRETLRLTPFFLDGTAAYAFFAVALLLHVRFRVNSSFLVILGALLGGLLKG